MPNRKITIATVNWYSCDYLDHLFGNLIDKAEHRDRLGFLVIDNSNGDDKELYLLAEKYNAQVIENNPAGLKKNSPPSSYIFIRYYSIKIY